MQLTRKCFGCKQDIRKDEMIQYSSPSGKTSYWYCKNCYEDKIEREKFSNKVCEIFGIKSPGPVIWTQRKKLRDTYGYTDSAIIDCLEYIYNVLKLKKLSESLVLVNPKNMNNMKAWRAAQKARASSIAAAIANTEVHEHIVKIRENTKKKKEINLDDALLDD
jgi:hypothetical protein